MFNIPSSFELGCNKITVLRRKRAKRLPNNLQLMGEADYDKNTIMVTRKTFDGRPICKDRINQVFFHEMIHQILNQCGLAEINNNEMLVDLLATYLYQAIKTMR